MLLAQFVHTARDAGQAHQGAHRRSGGGAAGEGPRKARKYNKFPAGRGHADPTGVSNLIKPNLDVSRVID